MVDAAMLFPAGVSAAGNPGAAGAGAGGGGALSTDGNPSTSSSQSGPGASSHHCITYWQPVTLRQEWTISNFATAINLAAPGMCLRSRAFSDDSVPDIQWQLCLYPGGKREENQNHVSLFLKMSSNTPRNYTVRAEYRFYFVDDQGIPRFSNVNIGDFKVKPEKGSHSWGLRNIPKSKVQPCIRADLSLQIICQIQLIPECSRMSTIDLKPSLPSLQVDDSSATNQYIDNIKGMMNDEDSMDFTIITDGESIRVHKFVLESQSEVFHAMLKHDTLEKKHNELIITDTKSSAVKDLVHYLYTSRLPDNLDVQAARDLLNLSDKYYLEPLKLRLQKRLATMLTQQNLFAIFEIAHMSNAEQLMNVCVQHGVLIGNKLVETPEYEDFRANSIAVAQDYLERVVKFREPINGSVPLKKIRLTQWAPSNSFGGLSQPSIYVNNPVAHPAFFINS